MRAVKITALHVFPVKSCRGIALERATITPAGFQFDRRWLIIDELARFQTQRELPRLAVIKTSIESGRVRLSAPGMPDVELGESTDGARLRVKIWNDECAAICEGERAAEALSGFLGKSVRLVRFDDAKKRLCDPQWTDSVAAHTQFSDGFPFLVLSEASLAHLNARMNIPLPMNRFRPNIVLGGLHPHDEDRIRELHSEQVTLRLVKPCIRCIITTTDQATGERRGNEPLRTLKAYRWDANLRGIAFGQNAILLRGASESLRVGQELAFDWA